MESKGHVSPDGQWYWDGQQWVTALSPDGRWRWDGARWAAASAPKVHQSSPSVFRQIPGLRTGAAWKLAVAGFVGLILVGAISAALTPPDTTSTGRQVAQAQALATASIDSRPPSPSHTFAPSPSASPSQLPSPTPTPIPSPSPRAVAASAPPPAPPPPAQDPYPAATAAGASAVCADGTWSYSKTRSGTCSHHGGVHWWTGNLGPAGPGAH